MLFDSISIDSILQSFESILKIEYRERETYKIIDNAVTALETAYHVTMDKDIYSIQAENQLLGDNLSMLLQSITDCCRQMSMYKDLCMFHRSVGISLADVNYIGFAKPTLLQSLKYLQDIDCYQKREAFIRPLTTALTNVDMCIIKRLATIMLVLERLGVSEGVSVIAQYLYLGGLVV